MKHFTLTTRRVDSDHNTRRSLLPQINGGEWEPEIGTNGGEEGEPRSTQQQLLIQIRKTEDEAAGAPAPRLDPGPSLRTRLHRSPLQRPPLRVHDPRVRSVFQLKIEYFTKIGFVFG